MMIANTIKETSTPTAVSWGRLTFGNGPSWTSFESFRKGGCTALEAIQPSTVGSIYTKAGAFRVLRDADFQRLIGLAAEVDRMKGGISLVIKAARVVKKHRDETSLDVLMSSVEFIGEMPVLPSQDGHDPFELTPEEEASIHKEGLDGDE